MIPFEEHVYLFQDEIDAIAAKRGSSGENGVGDRVLSQMLNELDGIQTLTGVLLIAATNRPDILVYIWQR